MACLSKATSIYWPSSLVSFSFAPHASFAININILILILISILTMISYWYQYWYCYQLDMIKICDNMLYLPPTSNIIFILFLPEGFPPHLESVLNVNGAFSSRSPLQMMAKLLHPCRIIGYNVSSMPTVYHFKRPIQQQWRSWYLGEAKNDSVEVRIVNDFFNSNHDHIFKGVNFSNFPHMMTLLCTYLMERNRQNMADGTQPTNCIQWNIAGI